MTPHQIDQASFNRRLLLAVLLPLIVMLVLAGILLWQVHHLLSVTQRVDHTDQVIARAHRTEKLLVDSETGLRGYLLTSDPSFLEPYRQALPQVAPSLSQTR
ncbi:MAG: hypothetical protein DMF64_08570 [Acidobacteria bacterium]|nr:MAG: hypothetical protein DMF64_08570 [Acidobacteriota bacterium]